MRTEKPDTCYENIHPKYFHKGIKSRQIKISKLSFNIADLPTLFYYTILTNTLKIRNLP